jgi:hypothetical protein
LKPLPPSAFNDCPGLFREEIETWINDGELPIDNRVLQAVLRGQLKQALRVSTRDKLNLLIPLVRFLDRACPECWGSPKEVAEWLHVGGLYGKSKISDEYDEAIKPKEQK